MNMQAVVLAGGIGVRLRPITYQIPKPMVPIHGKPFLQYELELVKSFGLTKVLILASYLGSQIEEYFRDGSDFGVSIEYSFENTPMGTGGALKNADKMLNETFVLLNGDTLLPINYNELIGQFRKCDKIGLIAAWDNPDKIIPNNLRITDNCEVISYNKDVGGGMTHLDAGAIVLKRKVLELIPDGCACSLEKEAFPRLIEANELDAFETGQRFYDMGSIKGLREIEKILVSELLQN